MDRIFNYKYFLYFIVSVATLTPCSNAEDFQLTTLNDMKLAETCAQVMVEAYDHIGLDAKIVYLPPKRALHVSNLGGVDGELMRIDGINKEFPNLIRVSVPICTMTAKVYTLKKPINLAGWQSLNGLSVGIRRGHLYARNGTSGMNAFEVSTNRQLLMMLQKHRLEAVVMQTQDAEMLIKENKIVGIFASETVIHTSPLFHYINRRHAALLPKLELILKNMMLNGRIDEIAEEHRAKLDR